MSSGTNYFGVADAYNLYKSSSIPSAVSSANTSIAASGPYVTPTSAPIYDPNIGKTNGYMGPTVDPNVGKTSGFMGTAPNSNPKKTTDSSSAPTSTFQPVYIRGKWYTDALSASQAQMDIAQQDYDAAFGSGQKSYLTGRAEATDQFNAGLDTINKAGEKSQNDLNSRYATLSPDFHQSSQDTNTVALGKEIETQKSNLKKSFTSALAKAAAEWESSKKSMKDTLQSNFDAAGNLNSADVAKGKVPSLKAPKFSFDAGGIINSAMDAFSKIANPEQASSLKKAVNERLRINGKPKMTKQQETELLNYVYGNTGV